MKQQQSARPLARISLSLTAESLHRARATAEEVCLVWRKYSPARDDGDVWQAAALECLLLPGVWEHMGRLMGERSRGHVFRSYEKPRRVTPAEGEPGAGLPGYVMAPWNGMPREGWTGAHHAGVAWDGVRRELLGDLGYQLQTAEHYLRERDLVYRGFEPPRHGLEVDYIRQALEKYRVRVPALDCICGTNGHERLVSDCPLNDHRPMVQSDEH